MVPEFQRVRDRELIERLRRSDADRAEAVLALEAEAQTWSVVDLALERGVLELADYRAAVRAWRDEPGPALTWGLFEVRGELGRGLGGTVYAAQFDGEPCALKLLRPFEPGDRAELITSRFLREVDVLRRLEHPGIVRLLDAGCDDDGTRYHATEFVEGGSLEHAVRTLDPARSLRLASHVARALSYAHGEGVIHRDLKPHNVLLDLNGRPRVVDFGLAKDEQADSLTHSEAFLGTALYAAPEQIAGAKRIDVRADVYGLGGVLRFMLTGQPPHQAKNLAQWLESARYPVSPLPAQPGLEGRALEAVNALLGKALQPKPEDRHPSIEALGEDVERARGLL